LYEREWKTGESGLNRSLEKSKLKAFVLKAQSLQVMNYFGSVLNVIDFIVAVSFDTMKRQNCFDL
jgi:hypothetical protein